MQKLLQRISSFASKTFGEYEKAGFEVNSPEDVQARYLCSMAKGAIQLLRSYAVLRDDDPNHMGLNLIARTQAERLFKATFASESVTNAVTLMTLEARGERYHLGLWHTLSSSEQVESQIQRITEDLSLLEPLNDPPLKMGRKLNIVEIAKSVSLEEDYRCAYSYFSKTVHGGFVSDGSVESPVKVIDWFCLIAPFYCVTTLASVLQSELESVDLLEAIQRFCR